MGCSSETDWVNIILLGQFNLISSVSFLALNKELVKNVFQLHCSQHKIDTASVYKVSCFPARSNQPF